MISASPEPIVEHVVRGAERLGLHLYPDPDVHPDHEVDGAPVVVVWPAMGVPARYYRPLAGELRAAGLGAAVVDLRGTGSSTPRASRRSRYGYADLADDVGAVLAALKPRLSGRRVVLLGHSLGGQACVLHLALSNWALSNRTLSNRTLSIKAPDGVRSGGEADVHGLALIAVGLPWYRLYPGRRSATVLAYTQSIVAMSTAMRVWPGWTFGGRQARGVIRDWGYTARRGRFPKVRGVDAEAAVAAMRTPVLAISVEHDQYTPAATVDHLCAKLTAAPVERVHLTAAEAGAPVDHFTWVRASAPIAARVARFAAAAPG